MLLVMLLMLVVESWGFDASVIKHDILIIIHQHLFFSSIKIHVISVSVAPLIRVISLITVHRCKNL